MAIIINGVLAADTDIELTTVTNDICTYLGYQDTINGDPNPESKAEFVIRKATEFLADSANAKRFTDADQEARDNVIQVQVQS